MELRFTKLLPFVLVLVLVLAPSSANNPSQPANPQSNWGSPSPQTCSVSNNIFLPTLISKGVRLLTKPELRSDKCGTEWAKFGTCCSWTSILTYIEKTKAAHSEIKSKFQTDIQAVIAATEAQIATLAKEKENNIGLSPLQKISLPQMIQKLKGVLGNLKKEIGQLSKNQQECDEKLLTFRFSTLCSICSSRSHVFIKDGKAIVGIEECKATIRSCDHHWSKMIGIINSIEIIETSLETVKTVAGIKSDVFADENHKELLEFIKKTGLANLLQKCSKENCGDQVASNICNSLIAIKARDPFTDRMMQNVESKSGKIKALKEMMAKNFQHLSQQREEEISKIRQKLLSLKARSRSGCPAGRKLCGGGSHRGHCRGQSGQGHQHSHSCCHRGSSSSGCGHCGHHSSASASPSPAPQDPFSQPPIDLSSVSADLTGQLQASSSNSYGEITVSGQKSPDFATLNAGSSIMGFFPLP